MTFASQSTPRRTRPERIAIVLVVVAYIVWLLSLPAFPTQDGPVHLYYTHVLRALLSHAGSNYARFYTIKHLFPPYAFYYYSLLGLSRFVSLLVADRLIVCLYVISFVFGFRYLASALGPGADSMTLLCTLLLLNWPLGMGFVNFCLSLSFVFWALGLWLRFAGRRSDYMARGGFVLLAILTMFTHPVPLLLLLGIASLDLVIRFLAIRLRSQRGPQLLRLDLITLVVAGFTLVYVKLFTSSRPLQQTTVGEEPVSFATRLAHNVANYSAEKGVAYLLGPGFELRLYRVLLLAVLIVPAVLALWQFVRDRREHRWTAGNTALILGIVFTLVLPFVPPDLNGSHFFAQRLLLFVWIFALLAACGARMDARVQTGLLAFALIAQVIVLHAANARLRPAALSIAAIDTAQSLIASRPGDLGLALEDPRAFDAPPGLSFNPYLWAAVNVFRHDNSVMANTPWLDLAIIPLGATPQLPAASMKPEGLEFPSILREELAADSATREALLNSVSFLVVEQAYRPPATGLDPVIPADKASHWGCKTASSSWLRICEKDTRGLP